MTSNDIARVRALVSDMDRLANEVQELFDDASAVAYSRPCGADLDHLDWLHEAAASAHSTRQRLQAALDA